MFFGSSHKMKSVIAAEVASLLAWHVIATTDRIGAITFNDLQSVTLMPKRSKQQVIKVLNQIVKHNHALKSGEQPADYHYSLENMFSQINRVVGHNALVIMISDGYGWNNKCGEYIKSISQHNDLIFCHVTDPLEHNLAALPHMVVSDGDTQIEFADLTQDTQLKFKQDVELAIGNFQQLANKYRIPYLPFTTTEATDIQLRRALGAVK